MFRAVGCPSLLWLGCLGNQSSQPDRMVLSQHDLESGVGTGESILSTLLAYISLLSLYHMLRRCCKIWMQRLLLPPQDMCGRCNGQIVQEWRGKVPMLGWDVW